jgi:hypothetical protein
VTLRSGDQRFDFFLGNRPDDSEIYRAIIVSNSAAHPADASVGDARQSRVGHLVDLVRRLVRNRNPQGNRIAFLAVVP